MYWTFAYYKPLILDREMNQGYVVILTTCTIILKTKTYKDALEYSFFQVIHTVNIENCEILLF